jgi:hypothetical protein
VLADAFCGSGGCRYGRGSERFVHVTLWRCCVREISTNVLVAGTKLVLRLANAEVKIRLTTVTKLKHEAPRQTWEDVETE